MPPTMSPCELFARPLSRQNAALAIPSLVRLPEYYELLRKYRRISTVPTMVPYEPFAHPLSHQQPAPTSPSALILICSYEPFAAPPALPKRGPPDTIAGLPPEI